MQVSASGYYAWRKRLNKPSCLKTRKLAKQIRNCYFENRRRYGARRISKALDKNGIEIGRGKVRRLMKQENLKAITAKAFKPKTRDSKATTAAPNLSARTSIRGMRGGKDHHRRHYLYSTARRQVLLSGGLAG